MQKGDKIKVVEKLWHKKGENKRVTIGIVQQIDQFKVTIKREVNGELKNNVSYNIADLRDSRNKFFILKDGRWKRIVFKISAKEDDFQRWKGGKYA